MDSDILSNFPFLTVIEYLEKEYVGIVQNSNKKFVTMYILTDMKKELTQRLFLELGDKWWWETNRQVPINMFFGGYFVPFRPYLKTFAKYEVKLISGPMPSLDESVANKPKRRKISLVKDIDLK